MSRTTRDRTDVHSSSTSILYVEGHDSLPGNCPYIARLVGSTAPPKVFLAEIRY